MQISKPSLGTTDKMLNIVEKDIFLSTIFNCPKLTTLCGLLGYNNQKCVQLLKLRTPSILRIGRRRCLSLRSILKSSLDTTTLSASQNFRLAEITTRRRVNFVPGSKPRVLFFRVPRSQLSHVIVDDDGTCYAPWNTDKLEMTDITDNTIVPNMEPMRPNGINPEFWDILKEIPAIANVAFMRFSDMSPLARAIMGTPGSMVLMGTAITNIVLSVINLMMNDGMSTVVISTATIFSSLANLFVSISRYCVENAIAFKLDEVLQACPDVVREFLSIPRPNAEGDEDDLTSWIAKALTAIVSLGTIGCTFITGVEAKDVNTVSALLRSAKSNAEIARDLSSEILKMLGVTSTREVNTIGEELSELTTHLHQYMQQPALYFLTDPDEFKNFENAASKIVPLLTRADQYQSKLGKPKFTSVRQNLSAMAVSVNQRIMEVRQVFSLPVKPDPACIVMYGEPNIGKSHLFSTLNKRISERFGWKSGLYSLKVNANGHYNPYKGEMGGEYDEFLQRKGKDPLLNEFNSIFGPIPRNLAGAQITEKSQYVSFRYAFMSTNTAPIEMRNELNNFSNKGKDAFWDRQVWIEMIDPHRVERHENTRATHRKADYSHLQFFLHEGVNEVRGLDGGERISVDRLFRIVCEKTAYAEKKYLESLKNLAGDTTDYDARIRLMDEIIADGLNPNVLLTEPKGTRPFVVRFQGPVGCGKTKCKASLTDYLSKQFNLPVVDVDSFAEQKFLKDKAIYVYDDILMTIPGRECNIGSYIFHVNNCPDGSIHLIFTNETFKRKVSALSVVLNLSAKNPERYYTVPYYGSHTALIRRCGLTGTIYDKTGNRHQVDLRDGVVFNFENNGTATLYRQHRDDTCLTDSQIKVAVEQAYTTYLASARLVSVRPNSLSPIAFDPMIHVNAPSFDVLKDLMSKPSHYLTAYMGSYKGCTVKMSSALYRTLAPTIKASDWVYTGDVTIPVMIELVTSFLYSITKHVPELTARVRIGDLIAEYREGVLYYKELRPDIQITVTPELNVNITSEGSDITLTPAQAVEALGSSDSESEDESSESIPLLVPPVAEALRAVLVNDVTPAVQAFNTQMAVYSAIENAKTSITDYVLEFYKDHPIISWLGLIFGGVLAVISSVKIIQYVVNYVRTEKNLDDIVSNGYEKKDLLKTIQDHHHKEMPDDGIRYKHFHICEACLQTFAHSHAKHSYEVSTRYPHICKTCRSKDLHEVRTERAMLRHDDVKENGYADVSKEIKDKYREQIRRAEIGDKEAYEEVYAARNNTRAHQELFAEMYGYDALWSNSHGQFMTRTAKSALLGDGPIQPNSIRNIEPVNPNKLDYEMVRDVVMRNIGVIRAIGGLHGIGICDRTIVTNAHNFEKLGDPGTFNSDETGLVQITCVKLNRSRDIAICTINKDSNPSFKFKDISSHIAPIEDLRTITEGYFVRGGTVIDTVPGRIDVVEKRSRPYVTKDNYAPKEQMIEFTRFTFDANSTVYRSGDCGFPLLGRLYNKVVLAGIHNGSGNTFALFSMLTTSDVKECKTGLKSPSDIVPNACDPEDSRDRYEPLYIEKINQTVFTHPYYKKLINEATPTEFEAPHQQVYGQHRAAIDFSKDNTKLKWLGDQNLKLKNESLPAAARASDPNVVDRRNLYKSPSGRHSILWTQQLKFGQRDKTDGVDKECLEHAEKFVEEYYVSNFGGSKILTIKEALNGNLISTNTGKVGMMPMDMSASPGPYFSNVHNCRTKADVFDNKALPGQVPFWDFKRNDAGNDCRNIVNDLYTINSNGQALVMGNKAKAKSELRPIEKVRTGNTRLFNVGDLPQIIHQRRLYGDVKQKMHRFHLYGVDAVGTDPIKDFNVYRNQLDEIFGYFFAFDCKNYDKSHEIEARLKFAEVIAKCTANGNMTEKQLQEHIALYLFEAYGSQYSISMIEGILVSALQGLFSGEFITGILNAYISMRYSVYVFVCYYKSQHNCLPTFQQIREYIRLKVLGDDNVNKMALNIPIDFWLTHALHLGVTLTQENIEKLTFLSRSMEIDPHYHVVFPALKKISLIRGLHWTKEKSIEHLSGVFQGMLDEAGLHDMEFFEMMKHDVRKQLMQTLGPQGASKCFQRMIFWDYAKIRHAWYNCIMGAPYPSVSYSATNYFNVEKPLEITPNSICLPTKPDKITHVVFLTPVNSSNVMSTAIALVNEWFQVHPDHAMPTFSFQSEGPQHALIWTCTVRTAQLEFTSNPTKGKQASKELACALLLPHLPQPSMVRIDTPEEVYSQRNLEAINRNDVIGVRSIDNFRHADALHQCMDKKRREHQESVIKYREDREYVKHAKSTVEFYTQLNVHLRDEAAKVYLTNRAALVTDEGLWATITFRKNQLPKLDGPWGDGTLPADIWSYMLKHAKSHKSLDNGLPIIFDLSPDHPTDERKCCNIIVKDSVNVLQNTWTLPVGMDALIECAPPYIIHYGQFMFCGPRMLFPLPDGVFMRPNSPVDIIQPRLPDDITPNSDLGGGLPATQVVPQMPGATNTTGGVEAAFMPVAMGTIGAVAAADRPVDVAGYATSDMTAQRITAIAAGIPDYSTYDMQTKTVWDLATTPLDCGVNIIINGDKDPGTIVLAIPYNVLQQYMNPYAKTCISLHKSFLGNIIFEIDMQGVPLMVGTLYAGIVRNMPPATTVTYDLTSLQRIGWQEFCVSGTQTQAFCIADARQDLFFREVADEIGATNVDRPGILMVIGHRFANQFPEGTTNVSIRMRSYLDPTSFKVWNPVDVANLPTFGNPLVGSSGCPPAEYSTAIQLAGKAINMVCPDIQGRVFLGTDSRINYDQSTTKNCLQQTYQPSIVVYSYPLQPDENRSSAIGFDTPRVGACWSNVKGNYTLKSIGVGYEVDADVMCRWVVAYNNATARWRPNKNDITGDPLPNATVKAARVTMCTNGRAIMVNDTFPTPPMPIRQSVNNIEDFYFVSLENTEPMPFLPTGWYRIVFCPYSPQPLANQNAQAPTTACIPSMISLFSQISEQTGGGYVQFSLIDPVTATAIGNFAFIPDTCEFCVYSPSNVNSYATFPASVENATFGYVQATRNLSAPATSLNSWLPRSTTAEFRYFPDEEDSEDRRRRERREEVFQIHEPPVVNFPSVVLPPLNMTSNKFHAGTLRMSANDIQPNGQVLGGMLAGQKSMQGQIGDAAGNAINNYQQYEYAKNMAKDKHAYTLAEHQQIADNLMKGQDDQQEHNIMMKAAGAQSNWLATGKDFDTRSKVVDGKTSYIVPRDGQTTNATRFNSGGAPIFDHKNGSLGGSSKFELFPKNRHNVMPGSMTNPNSNKGRIIGYPDEGRIAQVQTRLQQPKPTTKSVGTQVKPQTRSIATTAHPRSIETQTESLTMPQQPRQQERQKMKPWSEEVERAHGSSIDPFKASITAF